MRNFIGTTAVLMLALGCAPTKGAKAPDDAGASGSASKAEQAPAANEALAELRALKEQGSFEELLAEAQEVAPTARDEEWQALLEAAAIGYLQQLSEDEDNAMAPVEVSERLVELYPFLADKDGFRRARAETGVQAHKRCYASYCARYMGWRTGRDWSAAVQKYSKIDPEYSAFLAAKMLMTRLIPETATGLFAEAVKYHGKKVCADTDLKRSVNEAKRESLWKEEVAAIAKVCGA